jgi:hypothetical protein
VNYEQVPLMIEVATGLSAIADGIMAAAALGAAVAAFLGLSTWRKQVLWQLDHELAKQTLLSFYRYKEAVYGVRHPAIFPNEMEISEQQRTEFTDTGDQRSIGVVNAYKNRWDRVSTIKQELAASLLECDASWGNEINELFNPIFDLEEELFRVVRFHVGAVNPKNSNADRTMYQGYQAQERDILYHTLNDETDLFRPDFKDAEEQIRQFLRRKLGRSKNA